MLEAAGLIHGFTHWHGWGWDGWSAFVALGTLVLAAVTFWLARGAQKAADDARVANQLPAVMDLLREYRSNEMRVARDRILRLFGGYDAAAGMKGIKNRQHRESAETVAHYLDNLGLLVASGLVQPAPFAGFLGGSARNVWRVLGPFIVAERTIRGPTYQLYFEGLVDTFAAMGVEEGTVEDPPEPDGDGGDATRGRPAVWTGE